MSERRMNKALTRLMVDREFLADFRRDPEATLRPYKLSDAEIEAIKAGDAASLAACGVDVVALAEGRPLGRIARRLPRVAAAAFALRAVVLPLAPAGAARARGLARARRATFRARTRGAAGGFSRARLATREPGRVGRARSGGSLEPPSREPPTDLP
ncbi:MAG: Os1348 family NHLP clan protein [Actinomycetota bacterium]|nr:Os1348 family NHLP clan protein [Actinomycetota bacterium]